MQRAVYRVVSSVNDSQTQRHKYFTAIGLYSILVNLSLYRMMHGSEWTLKYDEPKVVNVARGPYKLLGSNFSFG